MNDFSRLAKLFEEFSSELANVSEDTGAMLMKVDPPSYRPGPDPSAMIAIKSGMFKMLGSSIDRRLSFQHRKTRWPLTPQNSCNVGFLISSAGYGVGYFAGCGCLGSFREEPSNFRALMVDASGEYVPVLGYPCEDSDGNFIRLSTSNGYLVKFEIPPELSISPIRLGDINTPNEVLYSLGVNEVAWVMSEGTYLSHMSDSTEICTTCDSFHGFCGAPLFKADGTIVGLGARIRFLDSSTSSPIPNRDFGFSSFDRLKHILKNIPPEIAAQLQWEFR